MSAARAAGLLACTVTANGSVLPQRPGRLPQRLELHNAAVCCRLMRDKHGGELVAVKFIERGEKVGATNALLQWAGSACGKIFVEEGGGLGPAGQRVMQADAAV